MLNRTEIEDDALDKRKQTTVNRANATRAGEAHNRNAEQRRSLWCAHLDEQAKLKRWQQLSDARKVAAAVESFRKAHKGNDEVAVLFHRVSKRWYRS